MVEWTNTKRVLDKLGIDSVDKLKQKLMLKDPYPSYATGTLYNSLDYKVLVDNYEFSLAFTYPDKYYNSETKTLVLEEDRPVGTNVPIKVLEPWVIVKGIDLRGSTPERVAGIISRSIKEEGIKGKHYLSEIRNEIKAGIGLQSVRDAIHADLKIFVKKQLEIIK